MEFIIVLNFIDRVKDDYLANRLLRDKMRSERKAAKAKSAIDGALLKRTSLQGSKIKLVDEDKEDIRVAKMMKYNTVESAQEKQEEKRERIWNQDVFQSDAKPGTSDLNSSSKSKSVRNLEDLVHKHKLEVKQSKANLVSKSIGVVLKSKSDEDKKEDKKGALALMANYGSSSEESE